MTYASLMVHLELGHPNAARLQVTGDLAERFGARVIGIAACPPSQRPFGSGDAFGDAIRQGYEEIETGIRVAEAEFRSAMQGRAQTLEWRSTKMYELDTNYLACQARSADLIVTGFMPGDVLDASRIVNTGDIVIEAGRPVLLVPPRVGSTKLERMMVAWKDSREARRAVSDALPLLKKAAYVAVAEITAEDDIAAARSNVSDVVDWLKSHGVKAEEIAAPRGEDDADTLRALAQDRGIDVIVAGAYGHSRMREWVLGGMTRNLVLSADRFTLLSH